MAITIYKINGSPPARAAMMTAAALNLQNVTLQDVDLFTGEHLSEDYIKMNPQHTVPTLKDGDFVIWDSHAIATYLVSAYGKDDSLYPKDFKKRAVVDQRLHFDTGVLFIALRFTMFPVLFLKEPKFRKESLARIEPAYEFTERFLEKSTWIAGQTMTIADICCVATISSLNCIIPIDKTKFPKVSAWLEKLSKQDFYVKANVPGLEAFKNLVKKEYY